MAEALLLSPEHVRLPATDYMSLEADQTQGWTPSPSAIGAEMKLDINDNQPTQTTSKSLHDIKLENYISLGCLVSSISSELLNYPTSWTEIDSASSWTGCLLKDESGNSRIATEKLLTAEWIRLYAKLCGDQLVLRVYLLPHDVGRSRLSRGSRSLRAAVEDLLRQISISKDAWNGNPNGTQLDFDPFATAEQGSLFYIFNTLPSPRPNPANIRDRYTRTVVDELVNDSSVAGLKTSLYPYQARSAAMMIQREASPGLHLDPRFEERCDLDGRPYYFSPRELQWFKSPPIYESSRGGILAETMGLGKTVICLAVILATKNHLPRIPPQYQVRSPVRETVPRLMDIAITTAARMSIPAKAHFARIQRQTGEEMTECIKCVDHNPAQYFIPGVAPRSNRRSQTPPPKRMILCSGTIVVVPRNLVHQWKFELRKHVSDGSDGLKVLHMDNPQAELPCLEDLRSYDVILFSKPRFEKEIRDGSDKYGRNANNINPTCQCPYIGATRRKDCSCFRTDDVYSSPLKRFHWLRIIIDEGHEFTSATSNAVLVAQKLVTADRRWVVSGTPARDRLFGVEVDVAADADDGIDLQLMEYQSQDGFFESEPSTPRSNSLSSSSIRRAALEQRKVYSKREEGSNGSGAAKSIGVLAQHFLQVRPWWSQGDSENGKTEWDDYIYRHESHRGRTFQSFSHCLRRTLETLVIKTQPDDVERDIILPPLTHKVVRLEPSFHDRIIANLFVLFLTSNAVTAERRDVDYLWHKNSAKARAELIRNLRHSNFYWSGFSAADVTSAIDHATGYLEKDGTNCSPEDRELLTTCLDFARLVLASPGWRATSKYHELGLFVDPWPESAGASWALTAGNPLMIGISQLTQAQALINSQLFDENPLQGMAASGEAAMTALVEEMREDNKTQRGTSTDNKALRGVPISGVHSEPLASKRHAVPSPKKKSKAVAVAAPLSPSKNGNARPTDPGSPSTGPQKQSNTPLQNTSGAAKNSSPSKLSRKRKRSLDSRDLPGDSPLAAPSIIGTVSAKMSYLLDRILALHLQEKILIFYDGNNTAFYIAQCLDLLHIKHLIYAKSLSNTQRSKYIVAFDADDSIRVLLMDIRCGAFGLNVNKASRVFFVNPVCSPSSEAQAIKRSHRIGQDKPVYVETLVLKGTIEEALFERSKSMTRTEHDEASRGQLSDDQGIASIIQNARLMPLSLEEGIGKTQMAALNTKVQIFGRKGRGDTNIKGIDLDLDGNGLGVRRRKPESRKTNKKAKTELSEGNGKVDLTVPTLAEPGSSSNLPLDFTATNTTQNGIAGTNGSAPTAPQVSGGPHLVASIFGEHRQ